MSTKHELSPDPGEQNYVILWGHLRGTKKTNVYIWFAEKGFDLCNTILKEINNKKILIFP